MEKNDFFLSFFKHFAFFFAKHSLETCKVGNLKQKRKKDVAICRIRTQRLLVISRTQIHLTIAAHILIHFHLSLMQCDQCKKVLVDKPSYKSSPNVMTTSWAIFEQTSLKLQLLWLLLELLLENMGNFYFQHLVTMA